MEAGSLPAYWGPRSHSRLDTGTDTVVDTIDGDAWVGPPVFGGNEVYVPAEQYRLPQNIITAIALFVVQPTLGSAFAPRSGAFYNRPLLDQPTDLRVYDANTFAPIPGRTITLPSYSFQMAVSDR